jgi:diguanylate cyclase (GGDEF)-like protein/PAS domain S-box-containing protein
MVAIDDNGQVEVANSSAKRLLHPFSRNGELSPFFDVLAPWVGDLGPRARAFDESRGVVQDGLSLSIAGARDSGHSVLLSLVKRAPGQFIALVTDATAVAQLESETRQLTERLRAVDVSVRDYALYLVDGDGVVISWSASAERVHQCGAGSIVGQSMAMLAPEESGGEAHVRDLLQAALENGWSEAEGNRLRRDGTPFWATTVVAPIENGTESRTFQVITRDLSERRRLEEQLRSGTVSATDDLTGVGTRRGFFDVAQAEIARARRYGHPLTVLLLDPDRFRELNETHGTTFGDECLRAIAWVCRQESRNTDVIGRVGGEEFAVLLPSTELDGGLVLAERIRERMARHLFPGDYTGVRCTVSVGVAELRDGATTVDALLALAETAVGRAKQAGRNLVVGLDDEE